MDASKTEAIEGEIDRIIERRTREKSDANRVEELWKESVECHNEKCRQENRSAWIDFHLEQAERIERCSAELAARHRAAATRLEGTP